MKTMKKAMKNNKGFTLVELIIVVAIIALLIAMIAPNLTSFLGTASKTTLQANAKTAYTSVNAWLTQQRVEGNNVIDFADEAPLVIQKDGTGLKVTSTNASFAASAAQYAGLTSMFNAGEFNDSTKVSVTTTSYSVLKVTWTDGSDSATYPD